MKKMLVLLLTLCLLAGMVPLGAGAEEGTSCEDGTECTHEAAIGDKHYVTLQGAIDAATPEARVTLCNDIKPSVPITVSKTLTLDLAGHKISNTTPIWTNTEDEKHWSLIRVSGEGNLTITGDGTLKALENDCYAVDLFDTTSKCTIENGTFIGNIHAVYVYNGNLTVNGGTFSVKQKYSTEYPDEYVLNCYDDSYKNRTASITVSGGTFLGFNPQNCRAEGVDTNFCAEGYVGVIEKTEDENTYYTVKPLSEVAVAKTADGKMYTTLAEAVDVAQDNDTVTLLKDIAGFTTADIVTIPAGKTLTLDMNGKSITTEADFSGRPIINEGTLMVTGNGTIDSSSSIDGLGAINNKGTLTIENGTYKGAKYASGSAVRNTGSSAVLTIQDGSFTDATCAVFNEGTATINGGTFVGTTCSTCNSQIWSYTVRNYDVNSKMTINGGTFIGTQGAVSASVGSLTVNDGHFKTVDCDKKHGAVFYALYAAGEVGEVKTVINGGTFETDGPRSPVVIGNDNKNGDGGVNAQSAAEIKGGCFKAHEGVPAVSRAVETGQLSITGGYFTSDPSEYCPEGLTGLPGQYVVDGNTYQYMVGEPLDTDVTVATGETEAAKSEGVNISNADVKKIGETKADGLTLKANETAADLTAADKADKNAYNEAVEALNVTGVKEAEETDTITTVIAPRLEIEITGYDKGTPAATEKSLTLNIEAVYDIKATTNADNMVELNDDKTNASSVNTVTIEKNAGKLDTTGQDVVISIPLPNGFVNSTENEVYVQHKGYEYEAAVTETGTDPNKTYTATFTNPHGFSTFVLSTEPKAVATVNGTNYTNFQQAVNAAGTSTIEVKADGQTATGVTHSLTLKNSDPDKEITVIINGEKIKIPANGQATFIYTAPTPPRPTEEKHSITISTDGKGQVTGPSSAAEDDKVTLTVKPNADKELYDLKVTDEDGKAVAVTKVNDTTYTFTMPDGKVTIAATFGCDGGDNCPSKAFTDLGDKQWYHDSIDYAVENGLLEGTSPTTMEPNATLIRAQLAQILYNIEDKPAVTGEMIFEDVPASEWFYSPVLWANQNEIINGTSPTTFEPLEDISRQDLALMLYRYAGKPAVTGDLDGFTDADQVGDWAEEAMAWAVAEGIVQGDTPTTLNPTGTATRAEAAAMLQRFLEDAA